ncbi:MAG: hypothetical protein JSW65_01505 [Candidatus Bipolaricaulota bacterium]|nr:MAG: hypothetical protein JSW65_01505 [Candidatus Bipolaricaulota bacterium]
MSVFRVARMLFRGVSTALTMLLLVVVALVGAFRILFAVAETALGFVVKRELATRRFRRRLLRSGIEEPEVEEFTRKFRSMAPFLGSFRIRR